MTGKKRNVYDKAVQLLAQFPVLIIVGVRQCGKSTLSKMLAPDWAYFDLENGRDYDFITRDFDFFFQRHPSHIIFDEAQECPQLFRELRGVIDSDRHQKGRFILTGSSSPSLINEVSESLAGRCAILELGTFKANELADLPLPALYPLIAQGKSASDIIQLSTATPLSKEMIQHTYYWGGYPELNEQSDTAKLIWLSEYNKTYIHRDVQKLYPTLDPLKYRRFIGMLAELSGTLINRAEIGRSIDTTEATVRNYLEIANATFIWRHIPSFEQKSEKRLIKRAKGVFRDSGLSHFIKQVHSLDQLNRYPTVGIDFEGFVIEEIIKGLQATSVVNWQYSYYRSQNLAEVDLVLTGPFGIIPIEIKYGSTVKMNQLISLKSFIKTYQCPYGLVINQADRIEEIAPGIIQIPVNWI